jgi:hypothetical protein
MKKLTRVVSAVLPRPIKERVRRIIGLAISTVPGDVSIETLGFKHGTDKLGHGYLPYYATHFSPLRTKKLNILEIGVGGYRDPKKGGESLRLWQEYFRNGQIYGIDIHDKSPHAAKRIKTFQGSQDDPSFLEAVATKIGDLDIIIDDGSHINNHIITSFNTLFAHLKPEGIYVIEDINTSYLPSQGGSFTNLSSESTAIGMVKRLIDSLHYQYIPGRTPTPLDGQITSIHCYPQIVFIKKGENKHILSSREAAELKSALGKAAR